MKVGELVMLSAAGNKVKLNRFISPEAVGYINKDTDDNLYYVKWFDHHPETLHYRYELRRAK